MLKSFLENNHISLYKLAGSSSVPYSTLNDLANHKLPVEKLKSGQLYALSEALGISMNELYKMCLYTCKVQSEKYDTTAIICIKHKTYCLSFVKDGKTYEEEIMPVKHEATQVIEELAKWKLEELLAKLAMEDAYETIYSKTTR